MKHAAMSNVARMLIVGLVLGASAVPMVLARQAAPATAPVGGALAEATSRAWTQAKGGELDDALATLRALEALGSGAGVRSAVATFDEHVSKREQTRATEIARLNGELDELLKKDPTPINLSEGLKLAVELHMISSQADRAALVRSERIRSLIERAEREARGAEERHDWLMSAELFARLNLLLETEATYRGDARRLNDRIGMIRLYVPERLWELRNARRALEGQEPLKKFNALGEDFRDKLKGVTPAIVLYAVANAGRAHVERTPMSRLLVGGLESVRTMVTTHDLKPAFPGLGDQAKAEEFLAFVEAEINKYRNAATEPSAFTLNNLLESLQRKNAETVNIDAAALLHEFGNGAFQRLDEFSEIIWPDELARFKRLTEGSFIGVGIQIQLDEETQMVRVITPIEGTPAQRAGIRAGDLIRKIDDKDAVGMTIDQAVEQITGKANTNVTLTMEREKEEIVFPLTRAKIPIYTVKGWKRTGKSETDWDWFVDDSSKIAYVRLTQFSESTTRELRAAVRQMRAQGVRAMIMDLRFNPGGLLNEAVSVANMFIDRGTIVYTEAAGGVRQQTEDAEPGNAMLKDIPIAVLINESSASASEIVSGAIRHYADQGVLNAIVIGERSFGKGSVQNVIPLPGNAAQFKLTTQYYHLPNGDLIHRREGATKWGVSPHVRVEMLPKQISDALILRQDADLPADSKFVDRRTKKEREEKPIPADQPWPPAPEKLLSDGLDLQLEAAVALLRAKVAGLKDVQAAAAPSQKAPG